MRHVDKNNGDDDAGGFHLEVNIQSNELSAARIGTIVAVFQSISHYVSLFIASANEFI